MITRNHQSNKGFLNSQHTSYSTIEAWLIFGFLVLSFAFIFPELFFLKLSPMGGLPSAIKDPAVSWAAFMPAFREFRLELFEHNNILWSNLRSLGLPMLGNGVQAAPLFPLNLSLLWLPDSLYWSVMPILRVILIALGAYLLSRRVFGLTLVASLCFALLTGFNINVMRWINHPHTNGLLAGIWYTYFCCTLFINHDKHRSTIFWHWLGLVVCVFGMITNGFPETSALAAIFAACFFIAFIASNWTQYKTSSVRSLSLIVLAHIVGLSCSAVQIFALLEFIDIGAAMELRKGYIGGTYWPAERIPFALSQLTPFWVNLEYLKYLNFSIGLFGGFFFVRGLCLWLKVSRRPWIGISCLLMMALYIIKSFGLVDAVETAFANIPVLAQSHFPLYFSPLFYFGAAYFIALGLESYVSVFQDSKKQQIISFIISCVGVVVILCLCAWHIHYFMHFPWFGLIEFIFRDELRHFLFFLIGVSFLVAYQFFSLFEKITSLNLYKKLLKPSYFGVAAIAFIIIEMSISYFDQHTKMDHFSLGLTKDLTSTFDQVVENSPVPRHELRSNDRNGDYSGYGIGNVDNGVSAILPPDQRKVRQGLFETTFAGYFPVDKTRRDWAWEALSANLVIVSTTPRINLDWSELSIDSTINAKVQNWQPLINMPRAQPYYLEGSVEGIFKAGNDVIPWIQFKGQHHSFWMEGNISGFEHLEKHDEKHRIITKWRIRIPDSWLKENQYQMLVRLGSKSTRSYMDTRTTTIDLTAIEPDKQMYKKYANIINASLVAASPDDSLHIFYNDKALPRAYVASQCQANINIEESVEFLRSSDDVLKGHITIEQNTRDVNLDCNNYSADFKRVPIEADRGSSLELQTVTGPAIVAVNNYNYPGWKARDALSGEELTILRSNAIFRAVYLPEARKYQVQMNYQPWWLKIVYALLLIAFLLIVCVFIGLGRTQKESS